MYINSKRKIQGEERSSRGGSTFPLCDATQATFCLVTFIIEIGFADSFDSRIFSMNAKLRALAQKEEEEEEMITRKEADRKRSSTQEGRRSRMKSAGRSSERDRECNYFVLITKTLSQEKEEEETRKRVRARGLKKEKLAQRETLNVPNAFPQRLNRKTLYLYLHTEYGVYARVRPIP